MNTTYDMDSVSIMFPALGGHIFRMSAVFKDNVNVELVKIAIDNLKFAFPIMFTNLERTYTSYFHRAATNFDVISNVEKWITLPQLLDTDKPSFRTYVDGKIISVDFFHGNADGHVAKDFMCALVDGYCALLEKKAMPSLPIPKETDLKDPYKLYYEKCKMMSVAEKPSYVLTLPKQSYDYHRLSSFIFSVSEVKAFTKSYGCSINDFLCAIYYMAIVNATSAKSSKKDVTISVAIDLRSFYNSKTQRNFDYYCNVRFNQECKQSFDNSIKAIQKQIKASIEPENIKSGIASVHDLATNKLVSLVPRELKNAVMKASYHSVSDNGITTTLSNIGYHKTSNDTDKYLDRMEVYLNIFPGKVNAAAVGVKDKLTFGISYNSKDTSIDNEIKKLLKEYGIQYDYKQREFY